MNRHNDFKAISETKAQRYRTKAYYQELVARVGLGLELRPVQKRDALRLRAFNVVGRQDEKAR